MQRWILGAVLALTTTACIDATRVNTQCRWTDSVERHLDLGNAADRDHLRMDAKLAGELGLRLADLRYRNVPRLASPIRHACTDALYDSIIARHAVTRVQIDTATRARVWWADILAVLLPAALLLAVAMDVVTRRVCRSFEEQDRTMALVSITVLTPMVALLGLGITQFWSMAIEAWLLRNGHVSFRVAEIPAIAHGWLTYWGCLAVCAIVATTRFSSTPLTGGRTPYRLQHG